MRRSDRPPLELVLDALVTSALGLMVLVNVANIFCRKVLNTSLVFTTELSLALFIWMVFLGAVRLAWYDQHMSVTFLRDALRPGARHWLVIAVEGIVLVYCVVTIATAGPVLHSASLMRLSSVPWNAHVLFWALPVGFGGVAAFMAWRIAMRLFGQPVGGERPEAVD